jgi:hypothetical protein
MIANVCVCVCVCCLFHRAGPFILTFSPSLSLSSETACESDVCTLAHACVCMCACMCVLSALARFVPSRVPEAGLKGGVEDGWRKEEGVLLPEALFAGVPRSVDGSPLACSLLSAAPLFA